ncbi:MAG: cache domain-containing protein [Candidatus Omnitrophica bacterium]|nr:cache domain-containing protein [Candidatus Omnitrophota bacterium]
MKKLSVTVFAFILSGLVLCLPAGAQSEQPTDQSAQDLLIKSEVETAVSMLGAIYVKCQQGEMTMEQAKKLGADLLRELSYGSDGYFWADTTEGINVAHGAKKTEEGRQRLEDKDANGVFYIREFMEKAKTGGGYVEYLYTKKGQTEELFKRAYVLLFEPFGWVVGTGYYR